MRLFLGAQIEWELYVKAICHRVAAEAGADAAALQPPRRAFAGPALVHSAPVRRRAASLLQRFSLPCGMSSE